MEDNIQVEVVNEEVEETIETEEEIQEEVETPEDSEEEIESEEDEDPEESEEEEEKPKKKNGFKKRIDKFKTKLSKKDEEIEYWKQEALKANQSKPEEKTEEKKVINNDNRPSVDDFDEYEDYLEALVEYKAEEKIREKESKENEKAKLTKEQEKAQEFGQKLNSFREQTPDFDEVMEEVEDMEVSAATKEAIVYSENGPALMYELAKNPSELERINSLPPILAAKEIGKLEASLEKPVNKEIKTKTKAPRPIKPVGRGGSKVSKDISDPNLTQAEYEQLRNEQLRKKGA